jgi:hypothetical protein
MSRWLQVFLAVVLAAVLVVCGIGLPATGIQIKPAQLPPRFLPFLAVLGGVAFFRYRQNESFMARLLIVFWLGLVCEIHVYPMYLAARSSAPFYDAALASWDRWLGLQTPQVLDWIEQYPRLDRFLWISYLSLNLLMAAVLVTMAVTGRLMPAQVFVLSCVIAALISFPLLSVFPAEGPWTYYGYDRLPPGRMEVMNALKTQPNPVLDLDYKHGLITFPSFHAILAILAAMCLWSYPYVRWLGLVWGGLVVTGTVTGGWHYVIDVVAGFGIAFLSYALARAFFWAEGKWGQPALAETAPEESASALAAVADQPVQ